MMNKHHTINTIIAVGLLLWCCSCMKEQYRVDRRNQVSTHTKKSDNFLSDQAVEITKENNSRRDRNERKALKRTQKEQERLNELNSRSSKVKPRSVKNGTFNLY